MYREILKDLGKQALKARTTDEDSKRYKELIAQIDDITNLWKKHEPEKFRNFKLEEKIC